MTRNSRSSRFLDRADAALLAAVENYNKPDSRYREETFSILCLNAWELLLKARILDQSHNDIRSIYVYERRQTRPGNPSHRQYLKMNRSGNPHTIGLSECIGRLAGSVPSPVASNLEALIEISDSAVHFIVMTSGLSKVVLEVGTAAVRNYLELRRRWFDRDLTYQYNLYLLPIGLIDVPRAKALVVSGDERRLVEFVSGLAAHSHESNTDDFHVALEIDLSLRRISGSPLQVALTQDPSAPLVRLTEEDVRKQYPWTYRELNNRLRSRYVDFKENRNYHHIRKSVETDRRYVTARYLDPDRPEGTKKLFFNPNIVQVFDGHYIRK